MTNSISAMDGSPALSARPEAPNHTDIEPAPKETSTSKSIITYSHHNCADL